MAYTKFDWTKADEFYERSIAANPSWPQARQWYGEKLVYMGRFDESEQQLTRARDLDPLSSVVVTASALPDFFRGHYDRALETYRLAAELDPGSMLPHLWAGKAWLEKKEYAKALASFRKAEALSEHSSLLEALQAQAIFLLGDRAEAERRLKGLIERSRIEHVSHYSLAHLLIALGQIDRGFAELALAIRERDGRATSFAVDPLFASVRNDARFTLLLRQMGLGLPSLRHK
jgi:tetratricopeptide (TPR) repeat protein